jgi:hypothetical protein
MCDVAAQLFQRLAAIEGQRLAVQGAGLGAAKPHHGLRDFLHRVMAVQPDHPSLLVQQATRSIRGAAVWVHRKAPSSEFLQGSMGISSGRWPAADKSSQQRFVGTLPLSRAFVHLYTGRPSGEGNDDG